MTEIQYSSYRNTDALEHLVGKSVVAADQNTLTLSDGTIMQFDESADDCCSYLELTRLATTENIITAASFGDNEDETGGEGAYRAWLHVVTEAGELNIAEAEGDASNGYYLHGFALGVKVTVPDAE